MLGGRRVGGRGQHQHQDDSSEKEMNVTPFNAASLTLLKEQTEKVVPPDFQKQWGISDVVIMTRDPQKRPLHVNRAIMATFSPVFQAMFFSDFNEKRKEMIELDLEYDVLKEILRIIHSVDRKYGESKNKIYSSSMLAKLYSAGDKYDLPIIRDLCTQQFQQIEAREAFEVAIELELHDQKAEILKRMTFEDVEVFLQKSNSSLVLSPNDVAEIVKKCREDAQKKPRCPYCKKENVTPDDHYNSYNNQKHYYCNYCGQNFTHPA